jgi:hypothetical protein
VQPHFPVPQSARFDLDEIHFRSNQLASVSETQVIETHEFTHSHSSKRSDDSTMLALDVILALMAPKVGRHCDAFPYPGQAGHVDDVAKPAPNGQRGVFMSAKGATHIDKNVNQVLLCIA